MAQTFLHCRHQKSKPWYHRRMALWGQSTSDDFLRRFLAGDDVALDGDLLPFDIRASGAHARMLAGRGVLSAAELASLEAALKKAEQMTKKGEVHLRPEDEDGHSWLEDFLTKECGAAGKKIHTGRSRNDQVLVAMRLFLRDFLEKAQQAATDCADAFATQAKKHEQLPMPGYTHGQRAMPTTVSTWLGAFGAAVGGAAPLFAAAATALDENPLGSASGFGIANFASGGAQTAKDLGFARVAKNPIAAGLSRGAAEYTALHPPAVCLLALDRFFADIFFFTADSRDFFHLPADMCTGSSIMPQKVNADAAELARGRIRLFFAELEKLPRLTSGMLSGYGRELGLTKGAAMAACQIFLDATELARRMALGLQPNEEALKNAMTAELFVTEQVYERVNAGEDFRTAYAAVKKDFFERQA